MSYSERKNTIPFLFCFFTIFYLCYLRFVEDEN